MVVNVVGSSVLIVGDLHLSDVYSGQHKDYLTNCFRILADIRNKVVEQQPSALVILGDLIGVKERNVRNREVLGMICKFFKEVSSICKVFVLRGNHDFSEYPDYQFLSELNLFETSTSCGGYFDYYGNETQTEPEVRFHLVDYGSENRVLDIKGGNTTDVVLGHNNYTIPGLTNWYQEHDGLELSTLQNFNGVYMVVSGHIHNPSPELYTTEMMSGGECSLFYTGCPTRPSFEKNMYETTWFVSFKFNGEATDFEPEEFVLPSIEDTFYKECAEMEEKTEEEIQESIRTEALKEVLDEILTYRVINGDLIGQVEAIPNASEEAKKTAVDYLKMALNQKY